MRVQFWINTTTIIFGKCNICLFHESSEEPPRSYDSDRIAIITHNKLGSTTWPLHTSNQDHEK